MGGSVPVAGVSVAGESVAGVSVVSIHNNMYIHESIKLLSIHNTVKEITYFL